MLRDISGIEWDSGNWPKCGQHGVSKEEIEELLMSDPLILPAHAERSEEVRYSAAGRIGSGRAVFVVFTLRQRGDLDFFRPISARYMHAKEVKHYER